MPRMRKPNTERRVRRGFSLAFKAGAVRLVLDEVDTTGPHVLVRLSQRTYRSGIALLLVLVSACHFGDARRSCDEAVQAIYDARTSGDRNRIEVSLKSSRLSPTAREDLISRFLERDALLGPQKLRRSYLSSPTLTESTTTSGIGSASATT